MIHLWKKEVSSFFTTPFGFVFIGIFLLLSGLTFTTSNLLGGNGDLAGMFGLLSNMSFMTFPILTMKQYAEERKAGTEQLLFSSRLKIHQIVLAKYLAALTVFVLTLLATATYVIVIVSYGSPNIGGILASYFGFFLLGSALIAICTLASSLSENQVTAAISSFGLLFVLIMSASFSRSMQVPVVKAVLSAVAISLRYDELIRGVFRLGPVVYYICYTAVFLYMTVKNLQLRRLS